MTDELPKPHVRRPRYRGTHPRAFSEKYKERNPERYGEELLDLALDILSQRPAPPAKFVSHQVITAGNVDHYYSNDALLPPSLIGRPA